MVRGKAYRSSRYISEICRSYEGFHRGLRQGQHIRDAGPLKSGKDTDKTIRIYIDGNTEGKNNFSPRLSGQSPAGRGTDVLENLTERAGAGT